MADPVKGYILEQTQYIKEIDCEAIIYTHEQTKAKILVMHNEDPHKSFCIGFRTPPSNSRGVAHIIEHSVLCGSQKYPLKDPFVELAKGSLNTYLNAMTYPDKTLYPISSQNDKDFHNLMDVYLDAVFFPNIYKYKEIMMQEGWRYHLEKEEDPIVYKGVVYNEMKGAFSSAEELGFRLIKETLFPDTAYAYESGGAPAEIPNLSYEEFLDFHRTYYHPSNSYICLYGDMEVKGTLEYMDKEYLSKFDYKAIDSRIKTQKPFKEIVEKKSFYSASEDKDNGLFLSYNFVAGDCSDRKRMLALSVLEYLLLDTPASPLKKALIQEEIGEDVYGAFQTHLKAPVFSIVAKNVKPEKKERFYTLIEEVIGDLITNGLPKHLLKGALQVKEFELREGDSSGYSKGLFYSLAAIKSWNYDLSPFVHLKYNEAIQALKSEMGTGYFEALLKEVFLQNTHAAKVELYPKKGLEKELEEEEAVKLAKYKASLSQEEIKQLIKETMAFNAFQAKPDDEAALHTIPLLKREDLRKEAIYPHYKEEEYDGVRYIISPIFTNQIVYLNWYIDLDGMHPKYRPYLGILVGMLGKLDTKAHHYEELSSLMDETIGGLSYHVQAMHLIHEESAYRPSFIIQSKALMDRVREQVELMREVLEDTLFEDGSRLLEIIREMKALMESVVSSDGHRIAYSRLLAHFSEAEAFEEETKGLSFYHFVCDLEKNWAQKETETKKRLKEAYDLLANKNKITVGITTDKQNVALVIEEVRKVINSLSVKEIEAVKKPKFEMTEEKEALVYPSHVNYAAMGYNFKKVGFKYHGGLMMLKTILSMDYLWTQVRVKNGAYGAFCDFRKSGNMFFVSYRDPNLDETLNIYRKVSEYVAHLQLSERELLQYLIGTISSLDFPFTPSSEGKAAQIYAQIGLTQADVQKNRDELFETDNKVLQAFAPMLEACMKQEMYCVFGNNQNMEKAKTVFKTVTQV